MLISYVLQRGAGGQGAPGSASARRGALEQCDLGVTHGRAEVDLTQLDVFTENSRKDLAAGNEDSSTAALAARIREMGLPPPIPIHLSLGVDLVEQ